MPANWTDRRRLSAIVCASGLLLITSSCATSPSWTDSAYGAADAPAVNAHYSFDAEESADESAAADPAPSGIVQLEHVEEPIAAPVLWPEPTLPAPEPAPKEEQLQPILPEAAETVWYQPAPVEPVEDTAAPIVASSGIECPPGAPASCPGNFLPADPRVPLPSAPMNSAACPVPYGQPVQVEVSVYEPELYPEEYICDGGDRGIRVHYTELGRHGLETEDTVAEFTDHRGDRHIRPSTRVCIYAPQFAAVRSMSLPQVNLAVDKLAAAHDGRPSVGLRSRLTTGVESHNDQPIGLDLRTRASGVEHEAAHGGVARVQSSARHIKLNNVFENELFLSGIQLDRTQEAYLAHAVQLAAAWTRELNPVIVARDAGGQEVTTTFHVEEYVGLKEPGKGELKIIKVVNEPAAVPGDIVTFEIHYENIGERPLYEIRIIDNLTPRLELLTDSAQSDREGRFSFEDNAEGSVVLTFELADPLPAKSAGTLTFQCRVR